jgi:hypothetical protein
MANTYVQIGSTVTVGSGGASSIDFTSIPATYTDLKLVLSIRATSSTYTAYTRFNGNSSGVYSYRRLGSYGSAYPAFSNSSTSDIGVTAVVNSSTYTANTFSNCEIYIPNYANTSYNKSTSMDGISENNSANAEMAIEAGLFPSTSAITSISIVQGMAQYSTATLYGIKNS